MANAVKKDPTRKVSITLPKDNYRYKDDMTVAVNGKIFRIQRGKSVEVPYYVADVIQKSQESDEATATKIEELVNGKSN